jgi:aerotaxis receptor
MDNDGKTVGYTAARRPATPAEIEEVIPVYKALVEKENK